MSEPTEIAPSYFALKAEDIFTYLDSEQTQTLQAIGDIVAEGRKMDSKPPFNAIIVEQDWPKFGTIHPSQCDAAVHAANWGSEALRIAEGLLKVTQKDLATAQASEARMREALKSLEASLMLSSVVPPGYSEPWIRIIRAALDDE